MHIPRRLILAIEVTLLGVFIWVVGLRGSQATTEEIRLVGNGNISVPLPAGSQNDDEHLSLPETRMDSGEGDTEAVVLERITGAVSSKVSRTTATGASVSAVPPWRLVSSRPVSFVQSSWPMLERLCLQQRYNCSESNLHNRSLTVDFLTAGSTATTDASGTSEGNLSSAHSLEHRFSFRSTMETGQRMKFSIRSADVAELSDVGPRADSVPNERNVDPWCCRTAVVDAPPTCYIAQLLVGHFHLNLMHSLFRVATLQRAVLELQESQAKRCPNIVPPARLRAHVRLLMVRRRPIASDNVGFLADLIPLVEGVDGVDWWPPSMTGEGSEGERQRSAPTPWCVSSTKQHNSVASQPPVVRRCRPTDVEPHHTHGASVSTSFPWNCSTTETTTSATTPPKHSDSRKVPSSGLRTLRCVANVRMQYDFIPFYPSPLRPETVRVFEVLRQSMERRWDLRSRNGGEHDSDANTQNPQQPRSSSESSSTVGTKRNNNRVVTVYVINRRQSRRILNTDVLVDGIYRMQQRQEVDGNGPSTEGTANRSSHLSPAVSGGVPRSSESASVARLAVEVIELEGLSLRQQAAKIRRADVVIAVHGAALAWALAMAHGSSLLELVPPGWSFLRKDTSMFQPLSIAAKLSEHIQFPLRSASGKLAAGSVATTAAAFSRNFSIHRKDLRKIVAWVAWRAAEHVKRTSSFG